MADCVKSGQCQREDGHGDVEFLREVPVDEARDVVRLPQKGGEISRHAQNEEEEGGLQCAGTRLCENNAPAERLSVFGIGGVFDELPRPGGYDNGSHEGVEEDFRCMDAPVRPHFPPEGQATHVGLFVFFLPHGLL